MVLGIMARKKVCGCYCKKLMYSLRFFSQYTECICSFYFDNIVCILIIFTRNTGHKKLKKSDFHRKAVTHNLKKSASTQNHTVSGGVVKTTEDRFVCALYLMVCLVCIFEDLLCD